MSAGLLCHMLDFASKNSLLKSLGPEDLRRLSTYAEYVELRFSQMIYEMDDPVTWVYFPEFGLLWILTVMHSGEAIETSIVGREGGMGLIEAVGGRTMFSRVIVQAPGRALRVRGRDCRAVFEASSQMRKAVLQQTELLLAESRQAIACRSLYTLSQRFCRWMLECQDASGLDVLPLTQEFLSTMLGVTRTSVTAVARDAQTRNLISYNRGSIMITDREGLEGGSCECRAFLQRLRRAL
jgi:CRP-like cAMP-binding protein